MSSLLERHRHPLLAAADALAEVLDQAATGNPVFLSVSEKATVLESLARARERVDGLLLSVLAVADDVAAEHGARSPAAWLAHRTRADYGSAARQGRLADALDARWHAVADALVEGRVSTSQAEVIASALDALPALVSPEIRAKAEAHLVLEAAHHTPKQLRILGRKVLEVVAPDAYDDEERRLLEAEEARARRRCHLAMRVNGDGTTDIRIRVPDATAERLQVYLEAYAAPRRSALHALADTPDPPSTADPDTRLPYALRLGHAFCALLEHLPTKALPVHGGSATTLLVTIGLDQLLADTGVAELASGGRVTAGEARRLACSAGIIPAVLGRRSEPLDLGRAARLFSPAQRKALTIRDQRCRAEGCTIPAAWCEAHHFGTPWASGGRTDLADGMLLCSHHHHLAHDRSYDQSLLPHGDVRFHRRR